MAKVSANVDSSLHGELADTVPAAAETTAVPAWLAARRSRVSRDESTKAESVESESTDLSTEANHASFPEEAVPPPIIIEIETAPVSTSLARKVSLWQHVKETAQRGAPFWVLVGTWLGQLGQYYGSAMIGASVSVVAHAVLIVSLAVLMIGGASENSALSIFGVFSKTNESELADVELDSSLKVDPGKDAAALEFPDLTQVSTEVVAGFEPGDSLRGVVNGTGQGDGSGGDGDAMPVPTVNVPSYAVTKGSFSAWTDPRDPNPGKLYFIVIQVRLPVGVKKYRASDLTGMVVGTDLYKQVIKFRSTEEFPIKEGGVQVRIPVPGAAKLVRDTIRIESRLLREKQTIQIEF